MKKLDDNQLEVDKGIIEWFKKNFPKKYDNLCSNKDINEIMDNRAFSILFQDYLEEKAKSEVLLILCTKYKMWLDKKNPMNNMAFQKEKKKIEEELC